MRRFSISVLALGAIGTAGYALAGLLFLSIQSPVFQELVTEVQWSGKLHVAAGSIALLLGLVQLSTRVRQYSITLHQNVGRIYVVLVLLSTAGAMISLPSSTSSLTARSAFWLLAILWPTVTLLGYPFKEDFSRLFHAKCMIISFALTCSAITLRLYLGTMLTFGIQFETCYPIAAWGGIITNLVVAFFVLLRMNSASSSG